MEEIIDFSEWEKIDLRVGQIKEVEDIENADKIYKLTINLGEELGEKIVCAGIKQHYSKEELNGKMVIVFTNLTPRKMKGIVSEGMILAAVSSEERSRPPAQKDNHPKEQVVLISPEKDVDVGSKVR